MAIPEKAKDLSVRFQNENKIDSVDEQKPGSSTPDKTVQEYTP